MFSTINLQVKICGGEQQGWRGTANERNSHLKGNSHLTKKSRDYPEAILPWQPRGKVSRERKNCRKVGLSCFYYNGKEKKKEFPAFFWNETSLNILFRKTAPSVVFNVPPSPCPILLEDTRRPWGGRKAPHLGCLCILLFLLGWC